jgi:hypothetical protein
MCHTPVFRLLGTLHTPQSSDHLTSKLVGLNSGKLPLAHLLLTAAQLLGGWGVGVSLTATCKISDFA